MPAAVWRDDDVERLVRAALDAKRAMGRSASAKFDSVSWASILAKVNAGESSFTKAQLQSKLQCLKQKFIKFKALKSNSGSGWDPLAACTDLSDPARVDYVKAHPGTKEFQSGPLALYEELQEIFDGSVAAGRLAVWSRGAPRAAGSEQDSNLASEECPCRGRGALLDEAGGHGTVVAGTTEGDGQDIAVAASILIVVSTQLDERCARALGKRKGVTTGDRIATALEIIADEDVKRARLLEQKRSAVDRAIADFLAQFGAECETRDRVQRIVYFANNPRVAAVYNSLSVEDKRSVMAEMMD